MTAVHTTDATRHNSWIKEGYRIDDHEHVVKKVTSAHVTSTGSEAQRNYGENFPPHFYPDNYENPKLKFPEPPMLGGPEGRDLSPRQAEVIHAVLPRRLEPLTPRKQIPVTLPQSTKLINEPPKSVTPKLDYSTFVGAKPRIVAKYGDYPELIQGAVINFAPSSVSPKFTASSTVQNAGEGAKSPGRTPQKLRDFYNPEDTQALGPFGASYVVEEDQPNATMETTVSGQSAQPKRVGRWTLAQLRQTDGIIPSQAGWNKGDSQKLMTNFGTPRNTQLKVKSECLQEIPEEISLRSHGEVRLQSGTNKYDSQKGMTGFGTIRNTSTKIKSENLAEVPEEKIRASDGIVRLQAGTNKYDSQKGMTGFGTARRETTKMIDSKHPEYDHERPDQSEIPLQSGTNKFASQKGMTGFGTNRRETSKIVDSAHPEYNPETSIDATSIPYQMGSNKYASQKGMTGFGQPRWEVLDPSISWQNRKSQGMVRLQSGTNRFASQAGMIGFGTIRNTTYIAEAGELPYEDMKKSEAIIPSQAGWNKGDSQKGYTSFGAPRDVRGKHLKRIWELEYPEEAEVSLDRL